MAMHMRKESEKDTETGERDTHTTVIKCRGQHFQVFIITRSIKG